MLLSQAAFAFETMAVVRVRDPLDPYLDGTFVIGNDPSDDAASEKTNLRPAFPGRIKEGASVRRS